MFYYTYISNALNFTDANVYTGLLHLQNHGLLPSPSDPTQSQQIKNCVH